MSKKKYKKVRRRRIVAILLTIFTLGTSFMDALQVSASSNVGIYIGTQADDVTEDTDTSLESPDEQDSEITEEESSDEQDSEARKEESSENTEEQNVEDQNEEEKGKEDELEQANEEDVSEAKEATETTDEEKKEEKSSGPIDYYVAIAGYTYWWSYSDNGGVIVKSTGGNLSDLVTALETTPGPIRTLSIPGRDRVDADRWGNSYFSRFPELITIVMPDTTTVGNNAFKDCKNLGIVMLRNVTSIGSNAFAGCNRLSYVSLGMTSDTTASEIATALTDVKSTLRELFVYEMTHIEGGNSTSHFAGYTALETVSFPKVTSVGNHAFRNCTSLKSVNLSELRTVGSSAFQGCSSLTSVSFPKVIHLESSTFRDCTSLTSVSFPELRTVGSSAFQGCSSLTSVSFPELRTVESSAFQGCSSLTSVSFPELTSVGNSAFQGCSSLTSVSFPKARAVGNSTFQGCSSLTSASFPEATSVGVSAFRDCTSLTIIDFPEATIVGRNAFDGCNKLEKVTIGMTSDTTASEIATLFTDARSTLKDLTVLNMTSIEGGSSTSQFAGYTVLETVSFPKVTSVGNHGFRNCTSLKSVDLPEVTSVGNHAFRDSTSLTSISFPKATSVANEAFRNCTSLTSVNLPEVTSLLYWTFRDCSSLTSVNLPKVTSLGDGEFQDCKSLTSISLPKVTSLAIDVFLNSGVLTVDLPMIETLHTNTFRNSSVELVTTRNGKQDVVKGQLATHRIVGIITDAPKLEDQSLVEGDLLELSNPSIINDSLNNVRATVSSSWKKDGKDVGVGLKYSVESVGISDAGKYQNVINVTFSNGTKSESFSTNEANVVVEGKVALTVKYLNMKGEEIADSETLTGKQGTEYTTEAKIIKNHTLNETPSNATGTFTDEGQTVTYVYGEYEWDSKSGTLTVLDNVTGKAVFWAVEHEGIENVKHLILKDSPNVTADFKIPQMDNLETLTLTNTTELGAEALKDSTSVKEIDMSKVTSVGNNAFSGCNNLEKVTIGMTSDTTASEISTLFTDAKSTLKDLTVPNMTSIEGDSDTSHFAGYTALETVSFPKVTSVGNHGFRNCTRLKSVNLPEVTSVGSYAFRDCTSLTSISLPKATSLGEYAFYRCTSLKSVSLPEVTRVESYGFRECSSLKSVSLPEVTHLEMGVFVNSGVLMVDIPMIEAIYSNAFANSSVELVTTRDGKQGVVKGNLATYRIVGIITNAPKLEDQSLTEGDLLKLSNPSIINDSLNNVKAEVSSSWKHDGKEAGTNLTYSVESVELSDAGKYHNVINVTFSNGTDAGSFSTNEANVTVEMEVGLWFSEVPSTIEFEDTSYQNKLLTINRKDSSLSMSIKDTRPSGSTWKVHASVENPLTTMDGKHQLGDSIIYKDSNGQTLPLNNMQQEVFSGTKGEEIITNIAWGEGEGPLLQLNPLKEQVKIGEKYTATITWTLMDVWSPEPEPEPEPEDNFKEGATFEADGYVWQVLKNDGKHALIITKDIVGTSRFNPSGAGNVYEGSVLETAMKDFYTNNLNTLKNYALPVNLPATSTSTTNTTDITTVASSGTPTAFATSTADVVTSSEAWPTNADRIAQLNGSNHLWRLRSRGTNNNFAVTVGSAGTISNGFRIISIDDGLRPALYIDIQAFAANER